MATLITGGGSQIGLRLAQLLRAAGKPVIFASRSGSRIPKGTPQVKFDWDDSSTFEAPWALGESIDYVYIIGPSDYDPLGKVKPFIDLAAAKGVKRFVALSASGDHTEKGPQAKEMGKVHTYLHDQGLDYVVLRPTWFTENILRFYGQGIKDNGLIQGVVEKGPIAFVAVEDIAQTAFKAITDVHSLHTREPFLVGPDFVSYQDVAAILTEILGREVTYKIIPIEEQVALYIQLGLSEEFAPILASIEKAMDGGADERTSADPRAIKGKVGVRVWIEENKAAFL